MRIIKSIIYRIGKFFPIRYSRFLGVSIGNNCKFISLPNWGSEPYLIYIGDHVELSNDVQFVTHDGGNWVIKGLNANPKTILTFKKIHIGNNVFIGAHSIILGGVNIGNNCVVGAGSIVTKDIPNNSVVCGVPARVVNDIFSYEEKLLVNEPIYDKKSYKNNKKDEIIKMCQNQCAHKNDCLL